MAVRRLETGGFGLLHGARARKRMLHSAFWTHGAGELDLVAEATKLFGGGYVEEQRGEILEVTTQKQTHINPSWRRVDIAPLDFLYPPGELAFLRNISAAIPRREGGVFTFAGGKRDYSSSHSPDTIYYGMETDAKEVYSFPDFEKLWKETAYISETKELRSLEDLINFKYPGQYDFAWYFYGRQVFQDKVKGSRKNLSEAFVINYLLTSNEKRNVLRALSILTRPDPAEWSTKTYERVVECLVRLDKSDHALFILEKYIYSLGNTKDSGFEVFMAYYIKHGKWDLVLKAHQLLLKDDLGRGLESRRRQLHTNRISRLVPNFFEKVSAWAEDIPSQKGWKRLPEDHLAEDLMKGLLSSITGPHAVWDPQWANVWFFIRKRGTWQMTKATWERNIAYLAANRRDSMAVDKYLKYRRRGVADAPTELLNRVLLCFSRLQDFEGMKLVFDDFFVLTNSKQPNRQSYSILMAALAKQGDSKAVQEILKNYMQRYPLETPQEISHMMQVYAVRGELDEVVAWFERISTDFGLVPDVVNYNTLINAYGKAGDVDGASRRVQEMLDRGLQPDDITYNIIMDMCARRGDVKGAESVFNLAKQRGYNLSGFSYQALASAFVTVRNMESADRVLEQVINMRFSESVTPIWNTVLSGHATIGETERVNQIFRVMQKNNIPFDYYTYGIVMHSLCLVDKMDMAENTLNFMREAGFHINSDKYAILMVGYTRLGEFQKVWDTFKRMLDAGIRADFSTLAVLLKAYALAEVAEFVDMEGDAVHLVTTEGLLDQVLEEAGDLDLTSFDTIKTATPPWLFTPIINVYSKQGAWGRAIQLFHKFLDIASSQRGSNLNLQMYRAMMQVYHGARDIEGVISMWSGLKERALRLHKPVSIGQPGSEQSVLALYRNELAGGLSVYVRAMARNFDIEAIDAEIEVLQKSGYQLDNINWNDYVQALVLCGQIVKAVTVCEKQLMSTWPQIKLYFFYSDEQVRGDQGLVLPPIRPFIRTIETIATELRILNRMRKRGDNTAQLALVEIFRSAPCTWEACDGLEDLESRSSKEMLYRLQRDEFRGNEAYRGSTVFGESRVGSGAGSTGGQDISSGSGRDPRHGNDFAHSGYGNYEDSNNIHE